MSKLKLALRPLALVAALVLVASCTGENHQYPAKPAMGGMSSISVGTNLYA